MLNKIYFVIGNLGINEWVYNAIEDGLSQAGNVIRLDEIGLLQRAKEIKPNDLLFFTNANFFLLTKKQAEKFLYSLPAKKIQIGFDDEYMLQWTLYSAKYIDHFITFDTVTYEYMRQAGIGVSFLGQHPIYLSRKRKVKQKYDVSFVGRVDGSKSSRYRFLKEVVEKFPNSYITGLNAPNRIPHDEMEMVYASSKINLSLTKISNYNHGLELLYQTERCGVKGRPFEVGAVGGFCLSERSPGLERLLKTGIEIDYFSSLGDALEKIEFYLNNEDIRLKMASNLEQKVLQDYDAKSPNLFIDEVNRIIEGFKYDKVDRSYLQKNDTICLSYEQSRLDFQLRRFMLVKSLNTFLIIFSKSPSGAIKSLFNFALSVINFFVRKIRK